MTYDPRGGQQRITITDINSNRDVIWFDGRLSLRLTAEELHINW